MSEISKVNPSVGLPKVASEYRDQAVRGANGEKAADSTEAASKSHQSKPTPSTEKPSPLMMSNVSLKFEVDEKTNEVTIKILDEKSKKVIRSIPPEELKDLRDGVMVELFT
ncbi:MAG TPA: flagellar protein FlaG [Leptolinea sp.]